MKFLLAALLALVLGASSTFAAYGQVGAYVIAPSPSPLPSVSPTAQPAPITGFAAAQKPAKSFFDAISDFFKGLLRSFGMRG
ncbi:MAG: hypothetical protein QXR53_04695 [Candidatus Norongarragalinales archaeon]